MIENMPHTSTAHEVLAVVFQVRHLDSKKPQLSVLLWERAMEPQRGAWSLPGGQLRHDEDMVSSVRRQLAEKVDLRELTHLEQLAVFAQLEGSHQALFECVRSLEREFSTRFQANIYLTPGNAQGFHPHYDSHDVFVVQLQGTKRWRVWAPIDRSIDPVGGKHATPRPSWDELGEPLLDLVLGVAAGYLLARCRFPGRDLLDAVQRALAPTELAAAVMLLAGGIAAVTRAPSAGLVLGICVVGAFATVAAGAWRVVRVAAAEQAIADRASTTKEDSCAGSCAGCDKLCG